MFPTLLILAAAYLPCFVFVRACMTTAPEAYEDAAGFHYAKPADFSAHAGEGLIPPAA